MLRNKILGIAITVLTHAAAFAQPYVAHTIDFRDSANATLVAGNTDNLATLLIDGYLTGALRGYRFDIGREVLKRAPLPPALIPPPWDKAKTYFTGDRVTYQGVFFELVREEEKPVPTVSSAWVRATILGEPVSTRYYWPALADTLSRQDFLKAMVAEEPQQFSTWWSDMRYYVTDRVTLNGRNYEARTDNENRSPERYPDDWYATREGSLVLVRMEDCSAVRVLSRLRERDGMKTAEPVMLSVLVNDHALEFFRSLGLHFYFSDVIQYLNRLAQQPLLYASETGYLGQNRLVLNDTRTTALLYKLQAGLKQKKIKLSKKMIVSPRLYQQFVSTRVLETPSQWTVFQKPVAGDLVLVHSRSTGFTYSAQVVASIPAAMITAMLPAQRPELVTYSEALTRNLFNQTVYDSLKLDSLAPVAATFVKPAPAPASFFWLERYDARIDSADQEVQAKLLNVWSAVQAAFGEKQLKPKFPVQSFYPCRLGIRGTLEFNRVTWQYPPDYSFSQPDQLQMSTLEVPVRFTECSVTYKQAVNPGEAGARCSPYEVSFTFMIRGSEYPVSYTMLWSEVKQALKGYAAEADGFVADVERGELNFVKHEVMYGVMVGG